MRMVGKVLMVLCLMGFVFVRADIVDAITFEGSFSGPLEWTGYEVKYAELTLDGYDASLYQIDDFLLSVNFDIATIDWGEGLNISGSEWWPWLGQVTPEPDGESTLFLRPDEAWREDQLIQLNDVMDEGDTLHLLLQGYGGSFTLKEISLSIEASQRPTDPVPEPATIVLLAGGVLGLAGLRPKGRWSRA